MLKRPTKQDALRALKASEKSLAIKVRKLRMTTSEAYKQGREDQALEDRERLDVEQGD